jgi:hypothetical protein
MQHPRLNLGLLGFDAAQRAQVQSFLALRATPVDKRASKKSDAVGQIPWQMTDYREANALLLCTAQATIDTQQIVRFPADQHNSEVVGVRPAELSTPYALVGESTHPINQAMSPNAPPVMLGDAPSMQRALEYFEASLHALQTLFAIAQHLLERRNELDARHCFHLVRGGQLDAIVDVPQQRVLVRDGLQSKGLEEAAWLSRPASANSAPHGFAIWSMEELAWLYAQHNQMVDLPDRYLKLPIFLRQAPQVRPSMINARQVELLELLAQEPCEYPRLATVFTDRALLQRDLYVLFACRAITTSPQRAGVPVVNHHASQPPTTRPALAANSVQPAGDQPFQLETMHAGLH